MILICFYLRYFFSKFPSECRTEITARIIGGVPATPGQFPHHASVKSMDRNIKVIGICSGSLIGKRRVLTAASCVHGGHVVEVGLGSNHINRPTLTLKTKQMHIHPNYGGQNVRYNIAVLEFYSEIPFSRNIRPILLDEVQCVNFSEDTILISGFGQRGREQHNTIIFVEFFKKIFIFLYFK